ncbi:unnamed protein product [Nippostrongylus brasiliensis]|uniref:Secreted protein n=1 Tax=Nippostrongylus brasiliensis TaxID=27835 RepID=A0A0N4YIM4_NIPBR|nr:unnamed protein product [Nippostrongylus brasiliensis]
MNVITLVAIAAFVSSVYGNSQCGPSSLRDHIEKLKKDHCSGLEGSNEDERRLSTVLLRLFMQYGETVQSASELVRIKDYSTTTVY